MTLVLTFKTRLMTAMKAHNEVEKNILRVLISEVNSLESSSAQGGKPITDEQIYKVIRKIMQSNMETLSYDPLNKAILEQENIILNEFLPTLLTRDQVREKLSEIIEEIKAAKSGQAIGVAMKFLKSLGDAVDGNDVKSVVEEMKNGS